MRRKLPRAISVAVSIGLYAVIAMNASAHRDALFLGPFGRSSAAAVSTASERLASSLVLGFAGDIMLDRGVRAAVVGKGGSYEDVFSRIAPELRLYDVMFGNLEGPISARGERVGSRFSFRMATDTAPALRDAGFDVLSVANNHSGDYGIPAMEDTWAHLRDAGILPVGGGASIDEALAPAIVERKGVRIAYLAFSEFGAGYMAAGSSSPGIAIAREADVRAAIRRALPAADMIVASFHWGNEYQYEPTTFQKRMADIAVEEGADIVVGHHPHVPGPLELRDRAVVAYSLGNFVFDQYFSTTTMSAPVLTVVVKDGEIEDAYIRTARMDERYRPGFRDPLELSERASTSPVY